eukprot:CAMPEP_0201476772 /NCGR_PEP_ID=MMETSP0151_2-20130828/1898_1 /ASSEMBLY_ACC=CAM_ASM_000257 /TAXON_ID=200890 /ORGANISM="Paramoeba atlantica, Strain 621/1 / CCAP 1560/9" /LENGTH=902 /DNA_ID=CAMNT_0047857251 /DNA_START=86 /DNA_END=2794 /DNA_ORIENTATION=-
MSYISDLKPPPPQPTRRSASPGSARPGSGPNPLPPPTSGQSLSSLTPPPNVLPPPSSTNTTTPSVPPRSPNVGKRPPLPPCHMKPPLPAAGSASFVKDPYNPQQPPAPKPLPPSPSPSHSMSTGNAPPPVPTLSPSPSVPPVPSPRTSPRFQQHPSLPPSSSSSSSSPVTPPFPPSSLPPPAESSPSPPPRDTEEGGGEEESSPPPLSSSAPTESEDGAKPKRCFIVEELLSTEKGYLRQLQSLEEYYVGPLSKIMSNEDTKTIWLNLTQLIIFHTDFFAKLDHAMEQEDHFKVEVGEILLSMVPFMKMYTVYMNGFKTAQDRLMELTKDSYFSASIQGIQADGYTPGMAGLTLLQGCPLSRIPRYVLLLKDLLKHTPEDHPDHGPLHKAFGGVENMANTINEMKRKEENQERMRQINSRLKGDKSELLKVLEALSRTKHDWEKHHFNKPVDCVVCHRSIYGLGIQGIKCKNCKDGVHSKCEIQAIPVCIGSRITGPSLVKHDRIFISEATAKHYRLATGTTAQWSFQKDLKNNRKCVFFYFNDGILVCYPTEEDNENSDYEFVNYIMFFNPLLSVYAEAKQSQDKTSFEVAPPEKQHLHVFKCETEAEKNQHIERIETLIKKFQESLLASRAEEGGEEFLGERQYIFKIPSTIKINSKKLGIFAAYLVDISDTTGNSATIVKRYSQFHSLNNRLMKKKKYAGQLPRMPKKKILNMDPTLVEKRCSKLEAYLNALNNIPGILDEPVLKRFLTTGVEEELGDDADSPCDVDIFPKDKKETKKEEASFSSSSSSSSSSSNLAPFSAMNRTQPLNEATRKSAWASSRGSMQVKGTHIVVTPHEGASEEEITVQKDQHVCFIEDVDEYWAIVKTVDGNRKGYIPKSCMAVVEQTNQRESLLSGYRH